jgi:glucokinase
MVSHEPGTPALIRDMNRDAVFRIIEESGPMSRADVARSIGLSSPTVSSAVEFLLERRLVMEVGHGQSSGGRRPTLLEFNRKVAHVVGVDLGGSRVLATVADLGGSIVGSATGCAVTPALGSNIVAELELVFREALRRCQVDPDEVVAVGVAAPGVTDPVRGVVRLAPALAWEEFSLAEVLANAFGRPVFVENDVNAAAIGERLFGAGKRYRDFVFVFVGQGVGAGIIVNGALYRGHGNMAGEIGYQVLDPGWVYSEQRRFGCLESHACEGEVLRWIKDASQLHGDTSTRGQCAPVHEGLAMDACDSRSATDETIRDAVRYLAMGLTNITWTLSPEAIILGGFAGEVLSNALIPMLVDEMKTMSPRLPSLVPSSLGDLAAVIGACSEAAEEGKRILLS